MEYQKDYSLLRPFDLEAAKQGDLLCNMDGKIAWTFAAGPDSNCEIVAIFNPTGCLTLPSATNAFRMAPLAWVEGKPVYKDDVLYHIEDGIDCARVTKDFAFYVKRISSGGYLSNGELFIKPCNLTWQKPKMKREGWMNCYSNGNNYVYNTEEKANNCAGIDRIKCIRIEWE